LFLAISILIPTGCTSRLSDTTLAANVSVSENGVNINTATVAELEALPGIGETIAKRIVEYREKNGKFRRPEYLMLVPGVSERRFRQIRNQIRTD
jgi:competence protein ComEA